MTRRYFFVEPLEAFLDVLPGFIARPLRSAVVALYFGWRLFAVAALVSSVAGAIGFVLWDDLPSSGSISVLSLLAGLSLFALWQWHNADRLRERVRSLEDELREGEMEYEYKDGDLVGDE